MALSVIQQMTDQNILVRVRSSWALGNLCDTMVLLRYVTSKYNKILYNNTYPKWLVILY
jgi:hypothetical protein